MSYLVSEESSFSDTKPSFGELAIDVAFNTSIKDAFEIGIELFQGVGTNKDVVEDSDGEVGHICEDIYYNSLKIR